MAGLSAGHPWTPRGNVTGQVGPLKHSVFMGGRDKPGHDDFCLEAGLELPYSTVTDLARLRGWSTSVPLATAA